MCSRQLDKITCWERACLSHSWECPAGAPAVSWFGKWWKHMGTCSCGWTCSHSSKITPATQEATEPWGTCSCNWDDFAPAVAARTHVLCFPEVTLPDIIMSRDITPVLLQHHKTLARLCFPGTVQVKVFLLLNTKTGMWKAGRQPACLRERG